MIKNKFQRLNKDDKKKAKEEFYQTKFGQMQKTRYNHLLVISILLIIYSLILLVEALVKNNSYWNYITSIFIFIIAIIFLIGRHKVIVKNVNNYLIKKK